MPDVRVGVMDPVSLIVAALVAGAAAGGKDVASTAVKDAYNGLKALLVKRFRKKAASQPSATAIDPVAVLEAHETEPSRWTGSLEDALRDSAADRDEQILAAAKALLEQADPSGSAAGKYRVDLRGAQGVQVGDHGQMTVTFGGPNSPPAAPNPAAEPPH
jgi:hypothetical protein